MTLSKFFLAASVASLAASASAGTFTSAGGAIPDNAPATPLVVTFNVTDVGPLSALSLTFTDLTHTWIGDIVATLTSPNGTVSDILRRTTIVGSTSAVGTSSNFLGTYKFIDSGADLSAALGTGTSAFNLPSGDYRASTRIGGTAASSTLSLNSAFASTPVFGVWTLTISDNAAADLGTLASATLSVTAVPEVSSYLMFGLGLVGLAALRRRSQV